MKDEEYSEEMQIGIDSNNNSNGDNGDERYDAVIGSEMSRWVCFDGVKVEFSTLTP